jgi:lambda family phage portal protein
MKLTAWDRFTASFAPAWTARRVRARTALELAVRHYDAAQPGRRTSGWNRNWSDANRAVAVAGAELRLHMRDLVRNNGYARKAQGVIANHTTGGWGITPRPTGPASERAAQLWKVWADTTDCHSAGLTTFAGIQDQVLRSWVTDGEVLIRRRPRRLEDGLSIPLQLQVLEADYLDTSKDGFDGQEGGPVINGVEHDAIGRRVAYWLYPEHPGSSRAKGVSQRVRASDVIHVFLPERPGQVRGVAPAAAAIAPLKDFDEFEDAELLRQKIAACFAAFVTDMDGSAAGLGEVDSTDDRLEMLEPGAIEDLPPGRDVSFGTPPVPSPGAFSERTLRKIAAGFDVTYEDLTGDYSRVNFSSARMARLSHWGGIRRLQWQMVVPQLCTRVWTWAMEQAVVAGLLPAIPGAEWTCPQMLMLDPEKEARALLLQVRSGALTHDQMVLEMGENPTTHWQNYAAGNAQRKALGIILDSDAHNVSQAGQAQPEPPADEPADEDEPE